MAGDITTIARPYAEAAFDRALETNSIAAWSEGLELLANVAEDATIADQISNRNVPRERVRDLILDVGSDTKGAAGQARA